MKIVALATSWNEIHFCLSLINVYYVHLNVKRSVFKSTAFIFILFYTECGSFLLQIVQIINGFLVPSMQWKSKCWNEVLFYVFLNKTEEFLMFNVLVFGI